jgi:hypothetical protein
LVVGRHGGGAWWVGPHAEFVFELGDDGADVFRVDGEVEGIGMDHVLLDLAWEGFAWGWRLEEVVEVVTTWGCWPFWR